MRIGAVFVGINRALAAPEKRYLLDDSGGVVAGVRPGDGRAGDGRAGDGQQAVRHGSSCWKTTRVSGTDALAGAPDSPFEADLDPFVPAGIAAGGCRGYPKDVHSRTTCWCPAPCWAPAPGLRSCAAQGRLPAAHHPEHARAHHPAHRAGGCAVIFDRSGRGRHGQVDPRRAGDHVEQPHARPLARRRQTVAPDDLATLQEVWTSSVARADPALVRSQFADPVYATYGLSEAPTVVTIDGPDGSHAAGGSGRPLRTFAIHVVDDEICIAPQTDGEWAGVYRPMLGYWQHDDAAAETLANGCRRRRRRLRRRRRYPRTRHQEPADHPWRRQRVPGR